MDWIYNQERTVHSRLQATRTIRRFSVRIYTITKLTKAYDDAIDCVQLEHHYVRHHYNIPTRTLSRNAVCMGSIRVPFRMKNLLETTHISLRTTARATATGIPCLVYTKEGWVDTTTIRAEH